MPAESGLRVCLVEARQTVLWKRDPGRPRTDESVELRANPGIAVERPKSDRDLIPVGPVPTERTRSTHRTRRPSPVHPPAEKCGSAPHPLGGKTRHAGPGPAFPRKCLSAFGTASNSNDSPKERAPSPRSGRRRRGTSRGVDGPGPALTPSRAASWSGSNSRSERAGRRSHSRASCDWFSSMIELCLVAFRRSGGGFGARGAWRACEG